MVSVKLVLDKRRKKKDGTCPIKLRTIHNRKTRHRSLGYSVLEKDWDEKGQRIKSSCKAFGNVNRINSLLNKEKLKALEIFAKLQDEGTLPKLSEGEIKKQIANDDLEVKVLVFGEEIIAQLQEAQKFGNARVYHMMLGSIRDFVDNKDFPMRQLSYAWLKKYEAWFLGKGNTLNGLSFNLRTLRALYNRAIKLKRISQDAYPFTDYKIKKEATRKRAISLQEIKSIKNYEPETDRQERAKDYFFLSFYMMGASFVDLAFLQIRNMVNGRIEYKRRKTGRLHSISISSSLQTILDKYLKSKRNKGDFILNVIKSDDPKQQMKNVQYELKSYNIGLQEIGEACGIEAKLTSYVARHSYATIAKYKGVPTAVISEALGHASEEVTQVYLDSFDKAILDKYHNMVIE
ncbi:MAG: site-specific integrase [Lewinella sp.]|nr:site-specific integrase [Lewinella sp.]